MGPVKNYAAPEPVDVETVVNGQLVSKSFAGDVTPADALEAGILADLAAAGVISDAPAPKAKKQQPTTEES